MPFRLRPLVWFEIVVIEKHRPTTKRRAVFELNLVQ